ncbi:MAG: hypothetical protein GKR94_26640 [Gammaproteobacteria bacterium]|nr:hypothetical protein [Gammaproteobacteria bacterium]
MSQLDTNTRDRLVSAAKSAAGALPFIGTFVGEIIDSVIPEVRIERVVGFLKSLDERVGNLDDKLDRFQQSLKSEEGLDIFEEGVIQASRTVSEERKKRLAYLVVNSLASEELKYAESRKLLSIYNELTDPEIIWLIYYSLNPVLGKGPHSEWVDQHPEVLKPISREMGAPQEQHERGALQDSYKLTLSRLSLTTEKGRTTSLTTLGRLMVRYITNEES